MNKSDFISDAVALDLGKSGVKVAETLEIEVGKEWWNLVNSANLTEAQTYNNRQFQEPIISGGEIHLAPKKIDVGAIGKVYNRVTQPVFNMAWVGSEMTPYYFSIHHDREAVVNGTPAAIMYCYVFDTDGELINTITLSGINSSFSLYGAFWDHTNQRIIMQVSYSSNLQSYVCAINSTGFSYAGTTSASAGSIAGYIQPKVFAESPGSIYTLFKQTGTLIVKKVTPAVGANAHTGVSYPAFITTNGVTISVASNYRSEEADLFYSRKHESVGIAWVDKTSGYMYYALESEGWGTAHYLSQVTADEGIYMTSFGNMVLPNTSEEGGEYFVAGLRRQKNGVLTRPSGYEIPTGFNIIGATYGDSQGFRIFGNIATNWYILKADYETMAITMISNPFNVGFNPQSGFTSTTDSSYLPVKIAEFGSRELFIVQVYGRPRTTQDSRAAILVCYDKNIGDILWVWGTTEWSNSALFPTTYSGGDSWRQQILQRVENKILFMQIKDYYSGGTKMRFEHYPVDIASVIACNAPEEVSGLLTNRKTLADADTVILSSPAALPFRPPSGPSSSISWDKSEFYYSFPLSQYYYSTLYGAIGYNRVINIDKSTWEIVSIAGSYNPQVNGKLTVGAVKFISEDRSYFYNFYSEDIRLDPYLRMWVPTTTLRFMDQNLGTAKTTVNLAGGNPIIVALNQENATFYPSASGTTVYLSGAVNSNQGYSAAQRRFTIPFTFSQYMVSEFEDVILFLGQVTDGEIPYTRIKCFEADYEPPLAFNANDFTETYIIDNGFQATGGMHTMCALGSWVLYRDITGMLRTVNTGAGIDEFIGGIGEPVESEASAYTYNYINNQYIPYPFAREGIKVELSNISKMTKITLPETQTDMIRTMLASGTDFRGSRCILRRIFPDHSDEEGSDIVLLDGYIQDWSYSPEKKGILFTVSKTLIDVGASFPKRLMNMGCSHVFKGVRCGYLGEDGICTKTKTDCTSKGAVTRFGGFPWVAARQRRVMWR